MREECLIGIYEKAFPEDIELTEMFSEAKKVGFDFFEISIDRTEKRISRLYDSLFLKLVQRDIEETGLPIGSIALSAVGTYTLGHPDDNISNRAMDIAEQAIYFAEKVGARIVQFPACDVPKYDTRTEESNRKYIENLKRIVNVAAAHGVVLGLENMENDYMDTIEKCMRIIHELNSPYLQLYPDSGNIMSAAVMYNQNPCEDMVKGLGKYLAFHLKETRPNKYGGLFYGEGHVDFTLLTEEAYRLGVRRYVMEYWYTGREEWKKEIKEAKAFFDGCFNKMKNKGMA